MKILNKYFRELLQAEDSHEYFLTKERRRYNVDVELLKMIENLMYIYIVYNHREIEKAKRNHI